MRFLAIIVLFLTNPAIALAEEGEPVVREESPFVGRYDGGGMEVAMGMVVRPGGTFEWRLSVGALDLRAVGTWEEADGRIHLTSTPKPTPPEFAFSGLETRAGEPWLRIVWAGNGEAFTFGNVVVTCANGHTRYDQVAEDGFPPPSEGEYEPSELYLPPIRSECDEPVTVRFIQSIHEVTSPVYDLRELGWQPGSTAVFEFRPHDLGLLDFSNVTGALVDGRIVLDISAVGRRDMIGPLEMRRLSANGE
jgi:hypothetical protein